MAPHHAVGACLSDVVRTLRSLGIESLGKRLMRNPTTELPPEDIQATINLLNDLGRALDGRQAAVALYSIRKHVHG